MCELGNGRDKLQFFRPRLLTATTTNIQCLSLFPSQCRYDELNALSLLSSDRVPVILVFVDFRF